MTLKIDRFLNDCIHESAIEVQDAPAASTDLSQATEEALLLVGEKLVAMARVVIPRPSLHASYATSMKSLFTDRPDWFRVINLSPYSVDQLRELLPADVWAVAEPHLQAHRD